MGACERTHCVRYVGVEGMVRDTAHFHFPDKKFTFQYNSNYGRINNMQCFLFLPVSMCTEENAVPITHVCKSLVQSF